MASIKLTGDTSGEITISAPAVAGTNTLTLPAETGSLLTDNISGDFTVDTSTFHVDSTNNRVGIGTTSPSQKLDVNGTINATAFTGNGSALTGITASSLSTASGSAPSYSARAWVNFKGSGTVTIKASGNVSSITDNGTGRYTLNFATNMPDANYAIATTNASLNDNLSYYVLGLRNQNPPDVKSTSQVRMQCGNGATGGATDSANISVTIFR